MLAGARVLVTGATGRLGRCIAEELVSAGCDLVLVVRGPSPESARERVLQALALEATPSHLTVVCGDVAAPWLGVKGRDRRRLLGSIDAIVHAAATTTFSQPLAAARAANVRGTQNVLELAERMPRLRRLAHVSTAFVAGRRTGRVLEDELRHASGFLNAYQQSKYEAELLVGTRRDVLPVAVFRPSIVLDGPGSIQCRSAFRFAFELVRRGLLPALPGSSATPVDLVTERDAASAIARLLLSPEVHGTYHVACGDRAPSLGDVVDRFGVRYLDHEQFEWELRKWRHARPRLTPVYDELASFIWELAFPKLFDTRRAEALLGGPVSREDPLAELLSSGAADSRLERSAVSAP